MPIVIFIIGMNFSLAAPNIRDLTSKKGGENATPGNTSKIFPIPEGLQKHSLGLGLGQTFMTGEFEDNGINKITLDFLYNYSASYSFDLLVNFHHSKHELKERYTRLTGLAFGIKGKLYHFDGFSPFALAGLGLYYPHVRRNLANGLVESEPRIVFGNHFGLGGELKLNDRFSFGILGQHHNPFDVRQETGPEVEGSYFKLLITTFYTF